MRNFVVVLVLVMSMMAIAGCGESHSDPSYGGTVYVAEDIPPLDISVSWGVTFSPLSFMLVNTSEEDVAVKTIPIGFESTDINLFRSITWGFELIEDSTYRYKVVSKPVVGTGGNMKTEFFGMTVIPAKGMRRFHLVSTVGIPLVRTPDLIWRAYVDPAGVSAIGLITGKTMRIDGGVSGGVVRVGYGGKG